MVKVLVNGGLFEISKVEEIVEKRVLFNGANIRLEICQQLRLRKS